MTEKGALISSRTSGVASGLGADEYRLALLGHVDFEGRWPALAAAARLVTDGDAKADLIRERLRPIAGQLTGIGALVDSFELFAARHWFRNLPCATTQRPAATVATQETHQ